MFVREVKYYFMTTKQLGEEVERLKVKLQAEEDFEVKMKYLEALADVMKTLIRRYRNDDEFMRAVRIELRKLQNQAYQIQEEF